jgi:hypothetical protein
VDRERLAEIAELLERIATDRSVLEDLPDEDRERFLKAVASVYHPDRVERRRMAKVVDRQRKAARVKRDDGVLHETGIRTLRRKPVFTTPNYFLTQDGPAEAGPYERGSEAGPYERDQDGPPDLSDVARRAKSEAGPHD